MAFDDQPQFVVRKDTTSRSEPASTDNSSCSCGCSGCAGTIVLILFFWAFFFGLSTSSGTFHIDLFPPFIGIR